MAYPPRAWGPTESLQEAAAKNLSSTASGPTSPQRQRLARPRAYEFRGGPDAQVNRTDEVGRHDAREGVDVHHSSDGREEVVEVAHGLMALCRCLTGCPVGGLRRVGSGIRRREARLCWNQVARWAAPRYRLELPLCTHRGVVDKGVAHSEAARRAVEVRPTMPEWRGRRRVPGPTPGIPGWFSAGPQGRRGCRAHRRRPGRRRAPSVADGVPPGGRQGERHRGDPLPGRRLRAPRDRRERRRRHEMAERARRHGVRAAVPDGRVRSSGAHARHCLG